MLPRYVYGCLMIYVLFVTNSVILCYQKRLFEAYTVLVDAQDITYTGAVDIVSAKSAVDCMGRCNSNDKCVSFFHNINSNECIMHSTYNTYLKGGATDTGWRYHFPIDRAGRCHPDYVYYRQLDLCYTTLWTPSISFASMKSGCVSLGGKLAAITSQEKQDYFELFLADRSDPRVCIDGSKQPDGSWITDDGSNLTYFNWYPGQPNDDNEKCLVMYTDDQMRDCLCVFSNSCEYVCEF